MLRLVRAGPGRIHRAALSVVLLAAFASTASGQYFGQNKIQYKRLHFEVLKTEHFDIYFYPSERAGVEIAARMAERWRVRLERLFAHTLQGRQPLILYASHVDFEQTNIIPGELGEGTGGVTEPLKRRIVLPLAGPLGDTDHVIGHELVHAFQFDITRISNGSPGQNRAEILPLWFIEGMAEYLSLGPVDPNTAMWLRDAVQHDELPSIDELSSPRYFPYRWGQAFWAYVGGRWGDDVIGQMLGAASAAGNPKVAIEQVLGIEPKVLSQDWHAAMRNAYEPMLAAATPARKNGRLVVKSAHVGDLNVGPSISPDGRWLAFLSTRSLFSADLYIADVANHRIVRRLTSTATNPHYSSIQFIYSAGAWDQASKHIAIATVTHGQPAIAIFNAARGSKDREIPLAGVDEVVNPTWAPDGHAICFVGMSGGLTDLFVYDLPTSTLRRLTDDAFADLQPAWSPDGRRIAFATDRFSSRLDTLQFGAYRLALIDPGSGRIEPVAGFTSGKHLNPQWSPDGSALYFISDRDGIPNVYRVRLDNGDISQVTTVGTGVSGITNASPALSIAADTGVAAFSVYGQGSYDLYTLDVEHLGSPPRPASMEAATLPPPNRKASLVGRLLANATLGLPDPQNAQAAPYQSALSLETVEQPMLSVGATSFGAAVGGGMSFTFGDMLGDRLLATAVQFNAALTGRFNLNDAAAQIAYFNQKHRWTWGVVAGQTPYYSAGFSIGAGTVQGEPAQLDQTIVYRQTERSMSSVVAYPLDRTRRIELQAGVSRTSFDEIVQTTAFSTKTGDLLSADISEQSLLRSLTLGTWSASFVSDTTSFGGLSPVQGQRYRIAMSPTIGTVDYTGVLADYRRYFMPLPFYTVAVRALHYGRYGSGSEDPRLFPLYLGYPGLVRGYGIYTLDATDCPVGSAVCPAVDQLLGSRMLVGNLELRFPLLRPFGLSQRMYGPLPMEVALFTDGGVAWTSTEKPSILGGTRQGISSAGVALRTSLLGLAVAEFDVVRPLQRPGNGWRIEFNLLPGF